MKNIWTLKLIWILNNSNISKEEIEQFSLKQIKYQFLLQKYISTLKTAAKEQENKENEIIKIFINNNNNNNNKNYIIIINTEKDLNRINDDKNKIENLKSEDLINEAIINAILQINQMIKFSITPEEY